MEFETSKRQKIASQDKPLTSERGRGGGARGDENSRAAAVAESRARRAAARSSGVNHLMVKSVPLRA